MDSADKSQLVKRIAHTLRIDRVGITSAAPVERFAHYKAWLDRGYAGHMRYLHENQDLRADPARLLTGARSVICIALLYHRPEPQKPATPTTGHISNYARGADYHRVIREKLAELLAALRAQISEPFDDRVCVDTAPVLERELAARAGLGWIGKHTLLLDARLGSYLFLGEAITTLDLAPDAPARDHCGTCTRCLAACPTDAFPTPHVLDARRCISYLTIEHRDAVAPELASKLDDWVYGCDVCQQVCPFNAKAPHTAHADLGRDLLPAYVPLADLIALRSGEYRRLVRGTAAARAHRPMLRRNAILAARNTRRAAAASDAPPLDTKTQAALHAAQTDPHPLVQQAATQGDEPA